MNEEQNMRRATRRSDHAGSIMCSTLSATERGAHACQGCDTSKDRGETLRYSTGLLKLTRAPACTVPVYPCLTANPPVGACSQYPRACNMNIIFYVHSFVSPLSHVQLFVHITLALTTFSLTKRGDPNSHKLASSFLLPYPLPRHICGRITAPVCD